jgi:hypothetical protein
MAQTTLEAHRAYRPRESARLIGLPESVIYAAIRSSELFAVRRGRNCYIVGEVLAKWLRGEGAKL